MPFALFATEDDARAFIARCDAALGYPCAGDPPAEYPIGWTLTHTNPVVHPDGTTFAVPVPDGDVVSTTGLTLEAELDATWFPTESVVP